MSYGDCCTFGSGSPTTRRRLRDSPRSGLSAGCKTSCSAYNREKTEAAAEADPPATWQTFTLHDFRRTAITGYANGRRVGKGSEYHGRLHSRSDAPAL